MRLIENEKFDEERALYGVSSVHLINCTFDGEADGESALKESKEIKTEKCLFNLRYPFWHDTVVDIVDCEMTSFCRAALWYSNKITLKNSKKTYLIKNVLIAVSNENHLKQEPVILNPDLIYE